MTPLERVLRRLTIDGDNCWEWTGSKNNYGYGRVGVGGRAGRAVYVHRFMYEIACGPIPDGLVIDHLCRNPGCANPAHLEPVTHAENIRRGYEAKNVTHCKRGHDLADAYVKKNGARDCRVCRRFRDSEDAGYSIRLIAS